MTMQKSAVTWYPDRKDSVTWSAAEVLHDFDGRPHLVVRVELSGVFFELRALEPWVRIGDVESRLVLIDPDGTRARAYFDRWPPDSDEIRFGYGEQTVLTIHGRYDQSILQKLDRERLPRNIKLHGLPANEAKPGRPKREKSGAKPTDRILT